MKKDLLIKQRDSADCGAACLASVAAYFGLRLPITHIRQYAGTNKRGTSLFGMIEAAERLQFQAKGVKAKTAPLSSIPIPSVFHLVLKNEIQHFVVVYKIEKRRVVYMDPAFGKMISSPMPEFVKSWSGVILILSPAENFQRGNRRVSVIRRFYELIQPHRSVLLQATVGALVYTILGLSVSIYVQKIVDTVLPESNMRLMNLLSIGMILLLGFKIFTGYFKSLIILRTGQQIDTRLILGYYKHLLSMPQRFFDSMQVGEIISRVNDALRIRVFINDVALNLVVFALTIMFSLLLMFLYQWQLALMMLLSIPVYILIYWISNRVNSKWQREVMESGAALESQMVESLQGVSTIRRFDRSDYFNFKTEKKFVPLMRSLFMSSSSGLILTNISELFTGLITIVILWSGSYLVNDHVLTAGELISFYTLIGFFTLPVQSLIAANKPMQDAMIAADRLFEIIDLETEKGKRDGLQINRFPEGDLIFKNLYFSYGPGNTVFNDLQLSIQKNHMTAIIGESGCGKSTLLALLQKLYSPDQGSVHVGELDIQYVSNEIIRRKIVAVPQHTDLFQGDIISNIAMGEDEPDLERILDICKSLGLHEFITRLPARYQTIIRERGLNLSGGQKQRIGIARALYMNPSFLILDEATSALDPESERKVQETLQRYHAAGTTIVIIAHRLSTIKICDTVIFLNQGKPADCGSHEQLLAQNESYAGWWRMNANAC